jgi:D-arabinose 1-dehydrogenase-like Zn-dependent alcohol dehydrogenase
MVLGRSKRKREAAGGRSLRIRKQITKKQQRIGEMKSEKMKMKAIRIHQYGGPEVLAQVEMQRPTPGHDEVLIKVHAASVNPVDWKLRAGQVKEVFPLSFPSTLGWDVSGTVEEAGNNVTQFKRGDEVYALVKGGGYAEYVVAKATVVAKIPRSLDHVHAAAVPVAGLTALQALFEVAQLRAGQKVLIHAAGWWRRQLRRPLGEGKRRLRNRNRFGKKSDVLERFGSG